MNGPWVWLENREKSWKERERKRGGKGGEESVGENKEVKRGRTEHARKKDGGVKIHLGCGDSTLCRFGEGT